jgi:hypothetical protein
MKRRKQTYAITGYGGMPGTKARTMTHAQWLNWSAKRAMRRRFWRCSRSRARHRKRVRFISLDSYKIDYFEYCQCAAACSGLIAEGFFPSAPCRPGTVFSLRLLRTLHAQGVLGSVSKQAWSAGLHMIFEEDLKTVLPSFYHEVCTYRERATFAVVLTAVASGCLPSLVGCTVRCCLKIQR